MHWVRVFITTVHHYRAVKLATISHVVDDIVSWQKGSLGKIWGGGVWMTILWRLGGNWGFLQLAIKKKKAKVNSVQ